MMTRETDANSKAVFDKVTSDDTFARLIGMELVEVEPGLARSRLSVSDQKVNMYRMAHGGAIFSVADQACEAAGNSFGEPAVALQHTIHFLSPGTPGDVLEATARVTQRSNRIGLIEFQVKNQDEALLATGQQLIYFKKGPDG
jgi:acyl-CoA thioesterase